MRELKSVSDQDVFGAATKESLYRSVTPSLKVLATDTITFNFTSSGNFGFEVPHNLGYIPVCRVFWQLVPSLPDRWYPDSNLTDNLDTATDVNTGDFALANINTTHLQMYLAGVAGFTYKCRYYIFEDRAVL